jgi:hypothetical protein
VRAITTGSHALPRLSGIGVAEIQPSRNGSERFPSAGLRRIEMEMRIVMGDVGSAGALAEQLTAAFGSGRVSLRGNRPEVGLRIEGDSDRIVLRVLDAVERWLEQGGLGSAEMWLGENSYRVSRWAPVEVWQ